MWPNFFNIHQLRKKPEITPTRKLTQLALNLSPLNERERNYLSATRDSLHRLFQIIAFLLAWRSEPTCSIAIGLFHSLRL